MKAFWCLMYLNVILASLFIMWRLFYVVFLTISIFSPSSFTCQTASYSFHDSLRMIIALSQGLLHFVLLILRCFVHYNVHYRSEIHCISCLGIRQGQSINRVNAWSQSQKVHSHRLTCRWSQRPYTYPVF